jgi:hypothetical protein
MNWKVCGRKRLLADLICYLRIWLERLINITKIVSQDSRSPGPHFTSKIQTCGKLWKYIHIYIYICYVSLSSWLYPANSVLVHFLRDLFTYVVGSCKSFSLINLRMARFPVAYGGDDLRVWIQICRRNILNPRPSGLTRPSDVFCAARMHFCNTPAVLISVMRNICLVQENTVC